MAKGITQKRKKVKRVKSIRKPVIPTSQIIKNLGETAYMVMTPYEIKIFNAWYYFTDLEVTAEYTKHSYNYCISVVVTVLKKTIFIMGLPSRKKFMRGILTKEQFLEAPILLHGFSTRLYHNLNSIGIYNLRQLIDLGYDKLSRKRHIGKGAMNEILTVLDKKGCRELLIKPQARGSAHKCSETSFVNKSRSSSRGTKRSRTRFYRIDI